MPTFKERGLHSYEPRGWIALFVQAGTPQAVVDKFVAESRRILKLSDVCERIESMGLVPGGETPEQFADLFEHDDAIYARIIKGVDIKLN